MNNIKKINGNGYDAEDIQVLEGLEAVRKRPAMYIGSTGPDGLHHLVYEVVDNSIDEALAGACSCIEVIINKDNIVTVIDNGRGIPVEIVPGTDKSGIEVVMTTLHAGAKFNNKSYKVSGGLHGVGVSVVNALSEWLEVEVKAEPFLYKQKYHYGKAISPVTLAGSCVGTGTKITFKPDKEIFETLVFSYEVLAQRFRELAFLNSGVCLEFFHEKVNKRHNFHYEGGIASFVSYLNHNKNVLPENPIFFVKQDGDLKIEISMQYNDSYKENIFTFANNINTKEGGTHLIGFKSALTKAINNYSRRKGFLKDNDPNFSGEDAREGLTAVISVKISDPQFEGQTKTKLGNTYVKELIDTFFNDEFGTYLEENPDFSRLIIENSLKAAKARAAAKRAKELVRRQGALEKLSLTGKLADCSSSDPVKSELFIVEGDSAGGSAKQGRDRFFQAILPLRGKILNVEKARMEKVLSNRELCSLVAALGTSIGDDFNLDKLRYHRVLIMTDADVDGSHIRTLLLTFFFRQMPQLIEGGHLYIAQPPLYLIKEGKKEVYLYSDDELDKYRQGRKSHNGFTMQHYKGLGEMDPEQLWRTTMNPDNRIIRRVTMEDAIEADEIFTLLMGDKVEPRKEFIQTNACYVKNLDV